MSEESPKRAANFTSEEVHLLIDLVKSKRNIIESKKTDPLLWKEKDAVWDTIAKEFNLKCGKVYRSPIILKKKYKNRKKRTKQKFADNRINVTGTGGGPGSSVNITSIDEEILGVRLEGSLSHYDDDSARDKQFMKDPATASSRIYIGSISEVVVPDNLEEKFKTHGKILGLVLQRGFGFIQFENETQAQAAIKVEHGAMFHGRKLIVRQAVDNKAKLNPNQSPANAPAQQTRPGPQNLTSPQAKPAPPQNKPIPQNKTPPQNKPAPQNKPPEAVAPVATVVPAAPPAETNEGPPKEMRNKRKFWPRNNDRHQSMDSYRDVPRDMLYYGMEDPYPSFVPPPIVDRPERNDCEIIVVSKPLIEYAEFIEQRLKAMGLIVDLLFPNEDVPIGRVLANISSRGCLYAILVMPQNEEHRSLTLNILHGIPQEHRNMPVEDAVVLIRRNFDAYMRGEKLESDDVVISLTEKHPEAIQMLFNLLAENRQLTSVQYDKIVNYLHDRMELQRKYEGDEGIDTSALPASNKQAELQSRIMNILNKSASESPKPTLPPTPTPGNAGAPTPLLNDPSVQKALDSLLSGDMFKSITA